MIILGLLVVIVCTTASAAKSQRSNRAIVEEAAASLRIDKRQLTRELGITHEHLIAEGIDYNDITGIGSSEFENVLRAEKVWTNGGLENIQSTLLQLRQSIQRTVRSVLNEISGTKRDDKIVSDANAQLFKLIAKNRKRVLAALEDSHRNARALHARAVASGNAAEFQSNRDDQLEQGADVQRDILGRFFHEVGVVIRNVQERLRALA